MPAQDRKSEDLAGYTQFRHGRPVQSRHPVRLPFAIAKIATEATGLTREFVAVSHGTTNGTLVNFVDRQTRETQKTRTPKGAGMGIVF